MCMSQGWFALCEGSVKNNGEYAAVPVISTCIDHHFISSPAHGDGASSKKPIYISILHSVTKYYAISCCVYSLWPCYVKLFSVVLQSHTYHNIT